MTIPLIYIAGPFRASSAWGVAENVRHAERFGLTVARYGGMPVIPHANTSLFHGQLTDDFWLEGTMALMRVCHGVVFIPGWEYSEGCKAEKAEALRHHLPIFHIHPSGIVDGNLDRFISSCIPKEEP